MHIVLVQFGSGAQTPVYQEIACALRAWGHTVWTTTRNSSGVLSWHDGGRVVAMQPGPMSLPDTLRRVPLLSSVWNRFVFLWFMLRVRNFLKQTRPHIVHVKSNLCVWVLPLLMPSSIRFILDIRQAGEVRNSRLIDKLKDWRKIKRWRIYSKFIYHQTCFLHKKAAYRVLGKDWSKWSTIVPLGVNKRFLICKQLNSVSMNYRNRVHFIYVGTISKVRYLEQILFAVQRILHESNEFQLHLLGPDSAQGFYHNLLNELELNSVVTIESPIQYKNIPDIVLKHDVALAYVPDAHAWRYQPTLKILEYRALGMPIIATDIEPNLELVEDGVNGLLVHNSVESLADGMLRFIKDRDFLILCKVNARRMRQGITWREVGKMYEQNVYMSCPEKCNKV